MRSSADDIETTVGQDPDDLDRSVMLPPEILDSGCYVTDEEPQRRTALLQDWCVQWAEAGLGFCYIHPHGPAPRDLLGCLPEHRLEDVVWIDFDRRRLPNQFDVPESRRVGIDPFEGPEDAVDTDALLTDPIVARTTDFAAICHEHHSKCDWNVTRLITTVLPWLYDEAGPDHTELSAALNRAGLDGTIEPLLDLHPSRTDPTARAHLEQARTIDPKSFTATDLSLGWPRDPFPSNPLLKETTYPLHRALTERRILLVSGALPSPEVPRWQGDIHRLGTLFLVANVVQRLWEAAQTHTTAAPFPLVLDGLADLVPNPGVRLREVLTHGSTTPLGLVAGGPPVGDLPEPVELSIRDTVDTRIVGAGTGTDDIPRSLWDGDNTPIERYLDNEESNSVTEGSLWWIRTGRAGRLAGDPNETVQSRAAVPRGPPTTRRDPDGVADAISRSVDHYGAEPSWLPEGWTD